MNLSISGASSGIGAATAKLFSQLGASLALTGRKEENLRKVGEECKRLGNKEVGKWHRVARATLYYLGNITQTCLCNILQFFTAVK